MEKRDESEGNLRVEEEWKEMEKESSYHMSSDQKAKKVQAFLEWKNIKSLKRGEEKIHFHLGKNDLQCPHVVLTLIIATLAVAAELNEIFEVRNTRCSVLV